MTNQLNLTFMWWVTPLKSFIKRKLGIKYVLMRSDFSAVLLCPDGPLVYQDKQDARKYAYFMNAHVVTYSKAKRILSKRGKR